MILLIDSQGVVMHGGAPCRQQVSDRLGVPLGSQQYSRVIEGGMGYEQ